ncbi:MAG TPA: GtrA family protein [Puia sp.]|nr:GtrA family protein [Puia sp.]
MRTYLKAQAASIVGSAADFLVSILLNEVFHCWYIIANISGNICGAIVQFILSRNWAFNAGKGKVSNQAIKYILFWAGNILLQTAAVYFLKNYLKLDYLISKMIASTITGLTYNYFVQKKYVFAMKNNY